MGVKWKRVRECGGEKRRCVASEWYKRTRSEPIRNVSSPGRKTPKTKTDFGNKACDFSTRVACSAALIRELLSIFKFKF